MKSRFTVQEANRTLPLVRRIVADILERGRQLRAIVEPAGGGGAREDDRRRATDLEKELRDLMRELETIGCSYKDWGFELGLVDFPAEIDGRAVYLCWRSDEEAVAWYHPVEEGFAGRRKVPDELGGE